MDETNARANLRRDAEPDTIASDCWRACSITGIVVANFISSNDTSDVSKPGVDLYLGDYVYAFEETSEWLRGFVSSQAGFHHVSRFMKKRRTEEFVQTLREKLQNAATVDGQSLSTIIRCGIFPRSFIALHCSGHEQVKTPMFVFMRHQTESSDEISELLAQTSGILAIWNDIAMEFFAQRNETKYDLARKQIVELSDLCKRLCQRHAITNAETHRLTVELKQCVRRGITLLESTVTVRDRTTFEPIDSAKVSYVQLYRMFNASDNGAVTNNSLAFPSENSIPSNYCDKSRPSVKVAYSSHNSFNLRAQICEIKWSNFIISRNHQTSASSSIKTPSKSSLLPSTTTSDSITLEFAVSLYDAKSLMFVTEPVRHVVRVPLSNFLENENLFDAASVRMDLLFADLPFDTFSSSSASIHIVVVVSRIFSRCAGGDAVAGETLPSTPMTPRKPSPISSSKSPSSSPPSMPPPPLPPGYGTADVTTSSPQQQHDYSRMKIALGCAVSYNLAPLFNNSFSNLRKISREKLIATGRGMETLLSALPLFYFSLDVLPNKDKSSIAKLLQHVLRQQKFATSPATLLYKMSNVSTLAPSSIAEGKNGSIKLISSPSNLYVLQAGSVEHMLNNNYWIGEELNFQALHAEEQQKFDFLLTWNCCAEPVNNSSNSNTAMPNIARTLVLNKIVLPTENQREIFVTLESLNLHLEQHPILTAGISTTTTADAGSGNFIATLKHLQPNVEVLVSVCNDAGHVVENAIVMPGEFHNFMTSSNDSSNVAAVRTLSHFCSEVYWKNPDPEWHDTLQLSLSDRELASAHLRFIIRLRSKKLTKTTATTHQVNSSTTFREKLLNASTPKLKYFNITDNSTRNNTNAHSPPSNCAASSAPLDKNDMILGVAYLPLGCGTNASNQFLKSGINDLFIHRLVVNEQHFDTPSSPHHQLLNGDFSSTAKRFFAKSRSKLFDTISGSGSGGSRSSRSNSVPRPLSSSTDGLSSLNDNLVGAAYADRAHKPPVSRQLSSKTSCGGSITNDDDAATDGDTRNCETPVPPPRHRGVVHSSATNVYEFDAAYLALPAKPPQQGSFAAMPATSDVAVTKKVVEKLPRSPSVGGRMTFSPMSTFGRSSKKKLAGTPQVSVDLSAGEVVILENLNDAAPRAKSNSVHSIDAVAAAELPSVYKSGPYATSSLERLKVRLHVCSTHVVQNRYLSTIINYSAASADDELEQCLKAFVTHTPVFVDFHQILQFLPDVLDALFGLLGSSLSNNNKQLELLCFRSILRVLASFDEKGQFRSCFDQYLNEQFYSPLAHRHILGILQRIISKCLRDAEAEQRRKYAAGQTSRRRLTDSLEAIDSDDGSVSGNLKNFLIRQRSSRASIFYLDFEVPEELATTTNGESVQEDSNVASAVDSNKSINVADDAGINYFTILDEVIKQLPDLFEFTTISYKQNQVLKAQLNVVKHKNPNGAPAPPPRTRSRSSHKTSETKLPPVPLTPVRSAAAAEPELSSHVLQIVQSLCKLLSNMPSRSAATTADTAAVDTSEIIALCMPKFYTTFVLMFPDLLRVLMNDKADCFSAELNLQLVLAVASIKFAVSNSTANIQKKNFETLSGLRLQFLAKCLPLVVPALLQECPTTFLKLVNVLCDAVVSKLAPTKECASMLMVYFELNTKFDINQYAVPSTSAMNAVTFADVLVLRLLIPVVDIVLALLMQEEAEDQIVVLDFVAVSMTLFGYSNTRTLQAVLTTTHCNISVPEAATTTRSIILDKFLRFIGILLERNLLINERWLLLIMESCRCLARFLLHLGSVMKRQFLVALNAVPPPTTTTDAKKSIQISKRHPAAAAASLSFSDDGDYREETDSCCNGTIVSGGGDVGSEIAEEEAGDEYGDDDEEEPIDVQLWVAYITSCVNLCTVDVLQLEQMFDYDNGRQFVQLLLNYGDMRITIVSALHALWYSFGRHRAAFMPSIVLPVLRLSLIPHAALRAKIIPLFFDMMQHEFYTLISVPYDVDDEAELLVGARRLSGKHNAAELYEQQQQCSGEASFNDDNAANFYESGENFARRNSQPVMMMPTPRMRKCVKANFELFESEIIAQIDALFDEGYGDAAYVQQFRACMSVPLNDAASAPSKMFQFAIVLIERISQQLELLLRYREKVSIVADAETKISAADAGSADVFAKMACTHAVMDFYDQIERHALYIRYLYRLRDLHLQQSDFTEIAFTLENHAKLLSWTDEPLSPQLQPPPFSLTTAVGDDNSEASEATSFFTHRQLKKHLLCSMIDCFEKSKLWEFGIQMCKELANVYEHDLYDYESLSSILKKQAVLFENIVVQGDSRPVVTYFYVGFWGNGYDEEFRNKHFIYRGANLESLGEFQQKMQSRFPHAQPLLTSMNEPSDDVKDSDKQFLQICRVEPVTDNLMGACCDGAVLIAQTQSTAAATSGISSSQHHQSGGSAGGGAQHVNWKIRKFYENNEISMFTFSKIIQNPHHSDAVAADPNNPFANMWLERTTYATKTTLPYLLRWSEVRYSTKNLISPCKNAVETVQNKHKLITLLVEKQVDSLQQALKSLKSSSNLVVNARKGKNDNNTYAGKRVSSLSDAVYQNATTTTPKIGGSGGVVVTLNKGFTQVLLGVLDAAVQGGIPKYEEAFLSPTASVAVDPEDAGALRLVIAVMIPVLEAALTVHEIAMYASGGEQAAQIAPMHKHLVQRFHIMRDTVLGKYGSGGGGGEQREMPPILARLMKVAVHAWMAMNGAIEATGSSGPAFTAVSDTVSRFGSTGAAVKKPTKPAGVSGTVSGSKRFRSISSVSTTAGVTSTRSTSITGEVGVVLRTHQGRGLRLTSANSFVNSGNFSSSTSSSSRIAISQSQKHSRQHQQQQQSVSSAHFPPNKTRHGSQHGTGYASQSSTTTTIVDDADQLGGTLKRNKLRESMIGKTGLNIYTTVRRHLTNTNAVGPSSSSSKTSSRNFDKENSLRGGGGAVNKFERNLSMLDSSRLSHILMSPSPAAGGVAVGATTTPASERTKRRKYSGQMLTSSTTTTSAPSSSSTSSSSGGAGAGKSMVQFNGKKSSFISSNDSVVASSAQQSLGSVDTVDAGSSEKIEADNEGAVSALDGDSKVMALTTASMLPPKPNLAATQRPPRLPDKQRRTRASIASTGSVVASTAPPALTGARRLDDEAP